MAALLPLCGHDRADAVVAWRAGRPISRAQFAADVARLAQALPSGHRHVLNACADRYRFAVGLCAALVTGRVSLLPPSHGAHMVAQMRAFAPDLLCLADTAQGAALAGLPLLRYDAAAAPLSSPAEADAQAPVPAVPGDRLLAYVFTSGSTGVPQPHAKHWGALVADVQAQRGQLLVAAGAPLQVLGTVPPQHMYGLESTLLLPLASGGALAAEHPFFPADIAAALAALPPPRVLVSTPVHLRALLDAGVALPPVALVLSATAPLAPELAAEVEARLGAPLQEIYGATECGQIASRRTTAGPRWRLFPQIALREQGGRCEALGGHVTQATPLGDALTLDAPGQPGATFVLHGRLADLVNVAGRRSSLAHLTHQLLQVPGVTDGVVFLPQQAERAAGVARLAAFAVAPGLRVDDVRRGLRERIEAVFMPRPLVLVQALPRNSTGKLPREALDALARQHLARGADLGHAPGEEGGA